MYVFLTNLVYALKRQGKLISEAEKEIGVSVGYLSRCIKRGDMPLSLAVKVANVVGLSIDELLDEGFMKKERIESIKRQIDELNMELKSLED